MMVCACPVWHSDASEADALDLAPERVQASITLHYLSSASGQPKSTFLQGIKCRVAELGSPAGLKNIKTKQKTHAVIGHQNFAAAVKKL